MVALMVNTRRQSFAYPLRLTGAGSLELASGDSVIQDRIRSILETRPGEMAMRREYGLSDQAFTAIPSPDVISERIRQAVEIQMNGEALVFVTAELVGEEGRLDLRIDWQTQDAGQDSGSLLGNSNSINYSVLI